MDSCQLIRKETKMEIVHFNQRQLAARWAISEATYRFPCLRWREREWAIHDVDRADPENGSKLPDAPRIEAIDGGILAWPTKLALTPILADIIIGALFNPHRHPVPLIGPVPEVAMLPWESARWVRPD